MCYDARTKRHHGGHGDEQRTRIGLYNTRPCPPFVSVTSVVELFPIMDTDLRRKVAWLIAARAVISTILLGSAIFRPHHHARLVRR